MKKLESIDLASVCAVYDGSEGDLWELVMGEQIHVGGFLSSMNLAAKADIAEGLSGVDFCCCNGAGMRFLINFKDVNSMLGIDASKTVIDRGIRRSRQAGLAAKTLFLHANVCNNGLADSSYDFVWGEDAWCYVANKEKLISEAVRILKPVGKIAFTDWIEGDNLSDEEAKRFMTFMKFPNILNIKEYEELLRRNNCNIIHSENTGIFAEHVDLYLDMLNKQLTYDALRLIDFDMEAMEAMGKEMAFMQQLAHAGKITQGMFVATKK
jgi:sarcosine/dimethylglycine N-methyltransferase